MSSRLFTSAHRLDALVGLGCWEKVARHGCGYLRQSRAENFRLSGPSAGTPRDIMHACSRARDESRGSAASACPIEPYGGQADDQICCMYVFVGAGSSLRGGEGDGKGFCTRFARTYPYAGQCEPSVSRGDTSCPGWPRLFQCRASERKTMVVVVAGS